ncbi:MAG: hypothetical protein WA989_18050 [Henriciella sp.]|uniref:hypothetical protein n=1 Tax=Henriciella sp. TaxID=1968823 RepID=UPI003C73874C
MKLALPLCSTALFLFAACTPGSPAVEEADNDMARNPDMTADNAEVDAAPELATEDPAGMDDDADPIDRTEEGLPEPEIEWATMLSAETPYINTSGAPIPAYEGPSASTEQVGVLAPGDGGLIEMCAQGLEWCEVSFNGGAESGYVEMSNMEMDEG